MLSMFRHPPAVGHPKVAHHTPLPVLLAKRLLLALALATLAFASPAYGSVRALCATHAAAQEQANRIPSGLVLAVALAESGRWLSEDQATKPWPWTVTSGKDSFYLPTKGAAIAKGAGTQSQRTHQYRCRLHADQSALSPQSLRQSG